MLCIAKMLRAGLSPASVQLNKLVAGGEIPDTPCALHRGSSLWEICLAK